MKVCKVFLENAVIKQIKKQKSKAKTQHKNNSISSLSLNIDPYYGMSSNEQRILNQKYSLTRTLGLLSWSTTSSKGCFSLNVSMVIG